jgi:hypothetical protein
MSVGVRRLWGATVGREVIFTVTYRAVIII